MLFSSPRFLALKYSLKLSAIEVEVSDKSSRFSSKSGTDKHKTLFNLAASNDQLLIPTNTILFL